MAGLARHGEVELDCPFCCKAKIKAHFKEGFLQARKSSISAGSKFTYYKRPDTYMVAEDCPNCHKTHKEIEQAFNRGITKEVPHEDRVKRLKDSGLPTVVEDKEDYIDDD